MAVRDRQTELTTMDDIDLVIFDLAGKQVRLRHLEELMAAPELWDD